MDFFLFYFCRNSYFFINHTLYIYLLHNGNYYKTTDYFFDYNVIYFIPSHDLLDNTHKLRDARAFYLTLALCFLASMAGSCYHFISICSYCLQINPKANVNNDINSDNIYIQPMAVEAG